MKAPKDLEFAGFCISQDVKVRLDNLALWLLFRIINEKVKKDVTK